MICALHLLILTGCMTTKDLRNIFCRKGYRILFPLTMIWARENRGMTVLNFSLTTAWKIVCRSLVTQYTAKIP